MADLETVASDLGWRFEIATKGGENSLSRATASRSSKRFDFGTIRRSIGHAFVVCLLAPPFSTIDAKGNYRFPLYHTHGLGSAYDKSIHEETMNHLPLGK